MSTAAVAPLVDEGFDKKAYFEKIGMADGYDERMQEMKEEN